MFTVLTVIFAQIRAQLRRLRTDEGGYTSETVIVTAVLVALALAVLAILVAKVTAKVNSINLGM